MRVLNSKCRYEGYSRAQRGIALLMAIFALMLLASIGLAMLYAADSETGINANFRDQQLATYAAIAGLQEGRERLRNLTANIAWPASLPTRTGTNSNVIYIINPAPGETVEPWNPSNKYFDWEICRENMPAGFCVSGAPPNSASNYTVIDNSTAASTDPWKRGTPLNYKWVRINLKSDNMIPGVPTRASADGTLVCYDSDGRGQIPKPVGYTDQCAPTGAIMSIVVPPNATGYHGTPTVTIAPPTGAGGTTATATADMNTHISGTLTNLRITNPGTGYTSAPTVTFVTASGGLGATAYATVGTGTRSVQSVSLTSAGSPGGCYADGTTPTVVIDGDGSGATAHAVMESTTSCIARWNVVANCNNQKNDTENAIGTVNGGGSGFVGSVVFDGDGAVRSATITNPGTGYTSLPTDTTGFKSGCKPSVSWTLGRKVSSVALDSGGSGYSTAAVRFATAPSSGGMPTASATLGAPSGTSGQVTSLNLTSGGSGYSGVVTVQLTGGGGTGATAEVDVSPGSSTSEISGFTITNAGSGYTQPPVVTISGAGGPTLTTHATISTTYYGQVAVITSYAETPVFGARRGAQAMMQMEVATGNRYPFDFKIGGAITMVGPTANFGTPNSNQFWVRGTDANSCGQTATAKPSIGVYDPDNTSAVTDLIGDLARPDHYPGLNASPDVESVVDQFGQGATPQALDTFVNLVKSQTPTVNQYLSSNPASPSTFSSLTNMGTAASPQVNYVDGNLSLSGNFNGYGILVVTGNLYFSGDYQWHGLIMVVGQGTAVFNGGGNAQITGSLYVAKTKDTSGNLLSEIGTPQIDYSGGGGNGIQYDHCWADNLLGSLPQTQPPPDTTTLRVLSEKTVTR